MYLFCSKTDVDKEKLAIQAYCGDPTRAMLCSSGARKSWQSKLTAGIR